MLSSIDINSIGHGIAALIELYAAYWAFGIRHALAVRLYRRQALGIGLVAVSFAALDLEQAVAVFSNSILTQNNLVFATTLIVVFLILFYWIDASMVSSRRSDPLLRDTLAWSRLRVFLWGLIIALAVVDITLLTILSYQVIFLFVAVLVAVPVAGIFSLPIAVRRSRDITFRRHLKWFALFTVLLLFVIPLQASSLLIATIASFAFIFPAGYSLYRSARSLIPLNKLRLEAE